MTPTSLMPAFCMDDRAKSMSRYRPQKGSDELVLVRTSSPSSGAALYAKIIP
jgi:hypothetical protein